MIRLIPHRRMLALSLLTVLCLTWVTTVSANINFFVDVMRNLQHYKVSGELINLDLDEADTGDLTFNLMLPSRRNNFEEVIMLGYLSTGYALKRTGLNITTVTVTAIIPSNDNQMITATAATAQLERVIEQEIDPHTFLGQLEWIR